MMMRLINFEEFLKEGTYLHPNGGFPGDILNCIRPLVEAPRIVVCGVGSCHDQTYSISLGATKEEQWVRLENKHALCSSAVVRKGELLLTGGFHHICSLFSPGTNRWRKGPSMPTWRDSHCSVQLGGVSVVCGGMCGGLVRSSTLLLPAGDAAEWTKGCEMVSARIHAGGAVVASADANAHRILVVGGAVAYDTPLDSCELYDAVADRWSMQEARLPQPMRCRSASIIGGSAVLAVQWDDDHKARCAMYDVRSSSPCWQPMALASARRDHAVVAVGEYSVAMLGDDKGNDDTVQLYDVRADRWSKRPEWRLPEPSSYHCAVVM